MAVSGIDRFANKGESMKQDTTKSHFEPCTGCGATISINVNDDNYCPNCVALEARQDALIQVILKFGESLVQQGYERLEVKDALEGAAYKVKELKQAA
jgi:hypothetical protein